ncbi:MAG: tRNA pseudouridine(38-40) synthase TruA [Oscillospiraceae bacterium]|jgi:tRNA pseudouridine38-40 synthase
MARTFLVVLSYIGKRYHGFQIQANADTVQARFQDALWPVLGGRTDIKGCSRTDAGVNASCFCVSFSTERDITPDGLCMALNNSLPYDIRVQGAREVPESFHARYSAISKRYVYRIIGTKYISAADSGRAFHYPFPFDAAVMAEAGKKFLGTHDFTAYCGSKGIKDDMTRTVKDFRLIRNGGETDLVFEADGFLYNMVRIMTGTLLSVGSGKLESAIIDETLRTGRRVPLMFTAPACGLWLDGVIYDFGDANDLKR